MSRKQVGKYMLDKKIGKGSYAQVWLGTCEETKETVAVKVISRHTISETSQLRQEVSVLKKIDHINIVKFKDLKKSAGHYYLILEYCQGGDLAQFIKTRGHISELSAQGFLRQISSGLLMLHRLNFIHRDLKPQNILLTVDSEDAVLKIADFGFARALNPLDMAATVCGSPLYMAPEILRHERYDGKADLWSIGSIFYELLFGSPPFTGPNPMQLLATIESAPSRLKKFPLEVSEGCKAFISQILVRDPHDRIAADEFFSHEYNLGSAEELALVVEELVSEESDEGGIVCIDWQETDIGLTGTNRALSKAHSVQQSGPLADDSFASTLCALAILLRHIAETVNGSVPDGFALAVRSCVLLDTALDDMASDKQARSVLEMELTQSLHVANKIKSQLSYRDYLDSGKPLGWIFSFLKQNMKKNSVTLLLVDFLLNEFDSQEPISSEEEDIRNTQVLFLRNLRNQDD